MINIKKYMIAAITSFLVILFQVGVAQAFDVRSGPIWNQQDAETKCHKTCRWYGGWNGQWKTTKAGEMSVCGCKRSAEGGSNDANAGPIWGDHDAPHKCPEATRWYGGWNGQWRTTRPGEMSVCGSNQNWH